MRILLALVILVMGLSGTSWAQGVKPMALADLAKYTGTDREKVLYDGAKREGKLVWYTSLVPHKEIAKTFQAKYPGVGVDIYRSDGVDLATRIMAESQAKHYIMDAIETTPPPLMPLRDSQMLLPYTSRYLAGFPDVAKEKGPGGLVWWASDRESLIGVGYNKSVFPAADIPKKYDDLLKPALRGKMATANNETGARAIGAMLKFKGEEFVNKLKAQEIRPHATTAAGLADMIVSGEVPLSFTMVQTNLTQPASKGAPVAWVPLEVVAVNAGGVAVSANTQHPHAALLFVDFLLSPEGQKMYAEKLFYSSPTKEVGFEKWYPEKGLTTAEYQDRSEKWLKLLREITRK